MSVEDIKMFLPTKMCTEVVDLDIMREALISIACEIRRFKEEENRADDNNEIIKTFKRLNYVETKIKSKNKTIKQLQGNLHLACIVAKIVIGAKEKDSLSFIKHLNIIKNESANLLETNRSNMNLICKLQTENFNIYNEINYITKLIRMGYHQLQKMRNKDPKEMSLLVQLKKIVLACGQYYADYCNEHNRCIQLERKNSFLLSKLNILDNNLAATAEELRCVKNHNVRLLKITSRNDTAIKYASRFRDGNKGFISTGLDDLLMQRDIYKRKINGENVTISDCQRYQISKSNLDVTSHLSAIKKLLSDQDCILEDLRKIAQELK